MHRSDMKRYTTLLDALNATGDVNNPHYGQNVIGQTYMGFKREDVAKFLGLSVDEASSLIRIANGGEGTDKDREIFSAWQSTPGGTDPLGTHETKLDAIMAGMNHMSAHPAGSRYGGDLGRTLDKLAGDALGVFTAGLVRPRGGITDTKGYRVNVPFTSAHMRDYGKSYANLLSAGQAREDIDTALDSKAGRIAGTVAGVAAGAAAGAGLSSAVSSGTSAAAAGKAAALQGAQTSADASQLAAIGAGTPAYTAPAAGSGVLAPAAAAPAATSGSLLTMQNLGTAASVAGAATPFLAKQKGPNMPETPAPPVAPTSENTIPEQTAAEVRSNDQAKKRTRTLLTGGRGATDYGMNSFAPSLIGNNTYLKSVIG